MLTEIQKIKHLHSRGGFGLSPNDWVRKQGNSLADEVDSLFRKSKTVARKRIYDSEVADSFVKNEKAFLKESGMTKREFRDKRKALHKQTKYAWLQRMVTKDNSALLEKMIFFWHGHFACSTNEGHLVQKQLGIFREYGLGNFRDLLNKISEDTAMMKYLNLDKNKKNSPNENYARELLELFSLGEGNYTETDIKEASRAFTGSAFDPEGNYRFVKRNHDAGSKTFLGKKGNFKGSDIIGIILEKKQCARFISEKVYKFFVNETLNPNHISYLTNIFYDSDYNIEELMKAVFSSDWFYNEENVGNKIKSPIELLVGIMKTTNSNLIELYSLLLFIERFLGQELYNPPNVKGWDGDKKWITASTLTFRLNLTNYLNNSESTELVPNPIPEERKFNRDFRRFKQVKLNFSPINIFSKQDKPVEDLKNYLLPVLNDSNAYKGVLSTSNKSNLPEVARSLMSLPEYQLC